MCTHMHIHTCMYICICIYAHAYTHIYIHMYILLIYFSRCNASILLKYLIFCALKYAIFLHFTCITSGEITHFYHKSDYSSKLKKLR